MHTASLTDTHQTVEATGGERKWERGRGERRDFLLYGPLDSVNFEGSELYFFKE